jgi:hypothetical protein
MREPAGALPKSRNIEFWKIAMIKTGVRSHRVRTLQRKINTPNRHFFRMSGSGEIPLSYVVTADVPGAFKQTSLRFDHVGKALTQANAFLKDGAANVSIRDGLGNHIEGSELERCCQSGAISANLKPVY